MSTLHEQAQAGLVPLRPIVVKSRRLVPEWGRRWWILYPDGTTDWKWHAEDARFAAHAWEPYSHDRLTNG